MREIGISVVVLAFMGWTTEVFGEAFGHWVRSLPMWIQAGVPIFLACTIPAMYWKEIHDWFRRRREIREERIALRCADIVEQRAQMRQAEAIVRMYAPRDDNGEEQ